MPIDKASSMRKLILLCSLLLIVNCIPLKFAPKIDDYKITIAKKFKRNLPRQYAFVFEDDKEADEFYNFINMKFDLGHENVELNVPIVVNNQTYFMSFHEREKTSEVVNLVPIVIDGVLDSEGYDPVFENAYSSRNSHWYILITVMDSEFNDCLSPSFVNQKEVISSLQLLKKEYQSTHHYVEALLRQ
jgi:hypothetical protein